MARTARNISWNVLEVLASAAVLFSSYKIVLHHLGVSALGIWALATAITALSRAADVGASAGTARSVAVNSSSGPRALAYVETGLLINLGLYIVIGIALFATFPYIVPLISKGSVTADIQILMPYVIIAFVMMNVSAVLSSALVGLYRSDLKSIISISGSIVQVAATWILIDNAGLRALAIGQILQYALMTVAFWVAVTRFSTGRAAWRLPYRWDRVAARELLNYGMRAQGLNIAGFLFEPATKFAISAACGVHVLGMYELASRGVMQVRQIIVTPSGNLTPLFAKASIAGNRRVARVYGRAMSVLIPLSLISMSGLIVISPVLSIIWIGYIDTSFLLLTALLSAFWAINIVALPSYYLGLGAGHLRWGILGAITTALSSPVLVTLSTPIVGTYGAGLGPGLAIALGALVTMSATSVFGMRQLPTPRYFCAVISLLGRVLKHRFYNKLRNTPPQPS